MTKYLGISLIGCGGIARSHAFALSKVPNARLIASVDINEQAAIEFQNRFGFATYSTDVDAVLARTDVDAVVIATTSKVHGTLINKALNAGKHVLVQKPMTSSLAEAFEVVELVKKTDLKLM